MRLLSLLSMKSLPMLRRSIASAVLALSFAMPLTASAAVNVADEFGKALQAGGITTSPTAPTIETAVGGVINAVLSLVGIGVFVLVVYAGALWIFAAGNEDKIEQSKKILKGSVLGLIVIFSAYVIVNFVFDALNEAISGNSGQIEQAAEQQGETPTPGSGR